MTTVQRILVAVDFSEYSERALDTAVGLAKKFGAELHLLHCYQVYSAEPTGFPYHVSVPASHERDVREAASARLTDWLGKATTQGVRAEAHLAMDLRPSRAIVALAEKLPADWVVVGTYGLTGLVHVLLGSVAERVIRHAPCPVLTVK